MTDTQLLPCPFCGFDACYVRSSGIETEVYCQNCTAVGPVYVSAGFNDGSDDHHAITAWNTRTDLIQPMIDAAVAQMKAERDAALAQVEQFRDTNRRMNRRLQLLEGWWQRKVERANYWRLLTMHIWVRDKKDVAPNMKAVEEMAYQRGYEDGFDQRFHLPKRSVKPRRIKGGKL